MNINSSISNLIRSDSGHCCSVKECPGCSSKPDSDKSSKSHESGVASKKANSKG